MQVILTPKGNVPIEQIQVGDDVLAFDMVTGEIITNQVLEKDYWTADPEHALYNPVFYKINGDWVLNAEQSIWRNDNQVVHISDLVIGDIVYNGFDDEVVITSIEEVSNSGWYRFEISGDHSYIVDNLTLHNASRFWVLGTGTWSTINIVSWAASSGGAGGQSVPGAADVAIFDAASGGGTVTVTYDPTISRITMGAFTGTLNMDAHNPTMVIFDCSGAGTRTISGTGTWTITGTATIVWNMNTTTGLTVSLSTATLNFTGASADFEGGGKSYGTVNMNGGGTMNVGFSNTFVNLTITGKAVTTDIFQISGGTTTITGTLTINGNSAINTIAVKSSAGGTLRTLVFGNASLSNIASYTDIGLTLNGAGNTWTLSEDLVLGGTAITALTLTAGTLNAGNKNITAYKFVSSNSNTRVITMGSGTWAMTGTGTVWDTSTTTGLTLTPSTSTIVINDTSATGKTMNGGSSTFNNIIFSGDNITLTGSNTWNNFSVANAGLTTGLLLSNTSTQTINGAFTTNGSAGNLAKLLSNVPGSAATLSKSGGIVAVNYMSIKDSTATGGAVWYAGANSTNVSGNTGWIFSAAPSGGTTIGNNMANIISNIIII